MPRSLQAVTNSLNSKYKGSSQFSLVEPDLDSLAVWQGPILDLSLEVGNVAHRIYNGGPTSEQQWVPVQRMLPTSQGGIRLRADWDAIETNLVRPLRDGAALPEFTLEGPLDLYPIPPTELQLWLPHSVEAGVVRRVLLRDGAAVTVRSASSVQLRRAIDLPSISLSDFVDFATEDKDKKHAAGLMHLATGLREKASLKWNNTDKSGGNTSGTSPALVALELSFPPDAVGTLLAAADEYGGLQRLRVRQLGKGVLELSSRDHLSPENSKALALKPKSPYIWPIRSAAPETAKGYEGLLREILARQVFGRAAKSGHPHAAPDLPVRLHRSAAEAALLLRMNIEVDRNVKGSKTRLEERAGDENSNPPTVGQLLQGAMLGGGPSVDNNGGREVWSAVVKVEGSAREGLKFSSMGAKFIQMVESMTATFAPEALPLVADALGFPQSNATMPHLQWEL